jgi:hypothetical protein
MIAQYSGAYLTQFTPTMLATGNVLVPITNLTKGQ